MSTVNKKKEGFAGMHVPEGGVSAGPHEAGEAIDALGKRRVQDGQALIGEVGDLTEVAVEGLVGGVPELGVQRKGEELLHGRAEEGLA